MVFAENPEKLFTPDIFFDSICISANRKAAQISLHRFRRTLYRFDFFEVGHGIGMSAEVDVLPLHVLHLTVAYFCSILQVSGN